MTSGPSIDGVLVQWGERLRAESRFGARLNPRKADLHRWRETFAEKLRSWGVDAEATRQATRGANRTSDPLWRVKAREAARPMRGQVKGRRLFGRSLD